MHPCASGAWAAVHVCSCRNRWCADYDKLCATIRHSLCVPSVLHCRLRPNPRCDVLRPGRDKAGNQHTAGSSGCGAPQRWATKATQCCALTQTRGHVEVLPCYAPLTEVAYQPLISYFSRVNQKNRVFELSKILNHNLVLCRSKCWQPLRVFFRVRSVDQLHGPQSILWSAWALVRCMLTREGGQQRQTESRRIVCGSVRLVHSIP